LVQGGVTLPQALEITADVIDNSVYKNLINETKREVDDGNPLASVFVQSQAVPVMVSQMLNLGEETGRLDQVLEKLTSFYSREIDNLVNNLVSLIEPLIMIIMGVAVGGMVAAIIMPMYNVATSF
jgi:type IV pilus assembly protein PilC